MPKLKHQDAVGCFARWYSFQRFGGSSQIFGAVLAPIIHTTGQARACTVMNTPPFRSQHVDQRA